VQIETIDLQYRGVSRVIASYLIVGPEGPVLVETGPGSTLETLLAGLNDHGVAPADIRHVFVTHIHLDHAGAAGWWAGQGATVYVHPFGAPHLIDPSKLIASATRIYKDEMETLWGEILPAPPDNVMAIQDGQVIPDGEVAVKISILGASPGRGVYETVQSSIGNSSIDPFGGIDDPANANINDENNPRHYITTSVQPSDAPISIKAISWLESRSGGFAQHITVDSIDSDNVEVLRNGDPLPASNSVTVAPAIGMRAMELYTTPFGSIGRFRP